MWVLFLPHSCDIMSLLFPPLSRGWAPPAPLYTKHDPLAYEFWKEEEKGGSISRLEQLHRRLEERRREQEEWVPPTQPEYFSKKAKKIRREWRKELRLCGISWDHLYGGPVPEDPAED